MSALAKPNFRSGTASNPFEIVNADLVKNIGKGEIVDPVNSTNNRHTIDFQYVQPYNSTVQWKYTSASLRDTAFTAIVAAIVTTTT